MQIDVNGEARSFDGGSVADALVAFGWGDARVATALNGTFVPKGARAETALNDGDRLEVLAAMQGG